MANSRPTPSKSAQEQKEENLENQLKQIREDIQYLRERCGPNGTGLDADFVLEIKTILTSKMKEYVTKSALYKKDAPNVGLSAIEQTYLREQNDAKVESKIHTAAFREVIGRIDISRKTSHHRLSQNLKEQVQLLLNKQNNIWSEIRPDLWKKAFTGAIDPFITNIEAEIKNIQDEKDQSEARGYPKTAEGRAAYEAAKARQIKLLEEYRETIKKELDTLIYRYVLDAIQQQKFKKRNNSGLDPAPANGEYGSDLTLHEHAREQLMLRSARATQHTRPEDRFNTTTQWQSVENGNVMELTVNPHSPLPSGKYRRGDRWSKWISYHAWMDNDYEATNNGVKWSPVSYRLSKEVTILEDIDSALILYNKQTGKQDGFINAGKTVNPNYLIALCKRSREKGYKLQLSTETRNHLNNTCPEKLAEMDAYLGGSGLNGVNIQTSESQRPVL